MEKVNLEKIFQKLGLDNFKRLLSSVINFSIKKRKRNLRLSQKQKIFFFESLHNLVSSGIPITNSLSIMLFQTKNKNLKFLLETMIKEVSKGKKLQEVLRDFDKTFSNFDVYIVKMGEVTGKLASSFETIKDREEKNAELKSKIIGALIYPSIVIMLSIGMITGFITFVIPRIQKMYSDAKVNLPSLTQKVIDISEFLQGNYLTLIIILSGLVFFITIFKNHSKTKIYADKVVLKFPIFGKLIKKKILVIFSSTLGTLLKNGIMINEAMNISKKSLGNDFYEKRLDSIIEGLNEGIPLSELMGIKKIKEGKDDEHFPIELASVVKIGEQTGKLPDLLIRISNKFNREIDSIVKGVSTVIEPVVIIFVGLVVGTMIMAILLPFFNMANIV